MALSQREAAQKWGVSRATIQRAIASGKLSLSPSKTIDPAEMLRVFGEPVPDRNRHNEPEKPTTEPVALALEAAALRAENASLKDRLADKDAHLADLRAEVARLTYDGGPARGRRGWWPWGKA